MSALLFGLIAAFCWGVHDILVRYVSLNIGIWISLLAVLVFGSIAQLPLVVLFGDFGEVNLKSIWFSVMAGFAFSVACIGHYNAFLRGPVRVVAPLIGCYAVLSFGQAALTGTHISLLQWFALAVLIAGIGLVSRTTDPEATDEPAGYRMVTIGYCLLAMVGFAATFALGQRASAVGDPLITTFLTRIVTVGVAGVVLLALAKTGQLVPTIPNARSLGILALMGTLDAVAMGVVLAAGIFDRAEFASASSSIFGLITVTLAWLFMREKISPLQWLGIMLVFAAIAYLAAA